MNYHADFKSKADAIEFIDNSNLVFYSNADRKNFGVKNCVCGECDYIVAIDAEYNSNSTFVTFTICEFCSEN